MARCTGHMRYLGIDGRDGGSRPHFRPDLHRRRHLTTGERATGGRSVGGDAPPTDTLPHAFYVPSAK